MRGGGLRFHFFTVLALMIVIAALAAAAIAYHLFDRELERALEARSQMLVGEGARVLDAGVAAGLELDQAQLQERALRHIRPNLAGGEVIAVLDATGRIVASTNPAEIGETVSSRQLAALLAVARQINGVAATDSNGPLRRAMTLGPATPESLLGEWPATGTVPAPPAAGRNGRLPAVVILNPAEAAAVLEAADIIASRPIQSLFGAPAGHVIARHPPVTFDVTRQAFIAKTSLTVAGIVLAGLIVAAFAAAWLPWYALRVAGAVEAMLKALYARLGTRKPGPVPAPVVPLAMRGPLEQLTSAVESREHELQSRADAIDLLDEAA